MVIYLGQRVRLFLQNGQPFYHHNVLSKEHQMNFHMSDSLCIKSPKGFQNRLLFTIGALTAMRPNAMSLLKGSQFVKWK